MLLIFLQASCGGGDSGTTPFKTLPVGNGYPTSLAFSPDRKTLAVGARIFVQSTDKWSSEVQLWRTDNWSAMPTLVMGEGVMDGGVGVAFSPDGTLLAAAEPAGKVHVWRTTDWQPIKEFDADRGLSALVAFSPDGKMLASTAGSRFAGASRAARSQPEPPGQLAGEHRPEHRGPESSPPGSSDIRGPGRRARFSRNARFTRYG